MQALLKHAAIAWNPIGQARLRLQRGTLTVAAVVVPFVGTVISCNLAAMAAQKFFFETLLSQLGGAMPDHPLITGDFAPRFLSAIGVLAPLGAVALLPRSVFRPSGRDATLAAMLVVAAAWAFYGAAIGIPVHFFSGVLATVTPELGLTAFVLLSIPASLAVVVLTAFFWFRILLTVLDLSGGSVAGITLVSLLAIGILAGFFYWAIMASI